MVINITKNKNKSTIIAVHESLHFERIVSNTHAGYFIHHAPFISDQFSPEEKEELQNNFRVFLESYEKIFKEDLHPIWLLDCFM